MIKRMHTSLSAHSWILPGWILVATLVYITSAASGGPHMPTLSPSDTEPEDTFVITIRTRSFDPPNVPLQVGRKTRLVFHNRDAELHAFVPVGLLAGLHLNISGDGAPQFDAHGFKRVIIPPQGKAELRFVPARKGIFPYFCDMPGHDMRATIVVN